MKNALAKLMASALVTVFIVASFVTRPSLPSGLEDVSSTLFYKAEDQPVEATKRVLRGLPIKLAWYPPTPIPNHGGSEGRSESPACPRWTIWGYRPCPP